MKPYPHIDKIKDYDAVILADGEFPTAEAPLRLLSEAPFVCACDGAVRHYPQADVIIGDGDSVPDEMRERLIQKSEQEDNDLTKATRYCLSKGMSRIVYLGLTGKREDHMLGNISLLVRYATEMNVSPILATDYGWFVLTKGNSEYDSFRGQQVSLFNISCRKLSSEGLKWQAYPFRQYWQGTLNEALGNTFSLQGDGWYMVYRTYDKKV